MVKTTGAAAGVGAVRPLNMPEPLRVTTNAQGWPARLVLGGQRVEVRSIEDVWRVEDEWWRGEPVSRTYFEVLTDDDRRVTLYWDRVAGAWLKQRYA